jgi:hypothetical protein
MKAQESGRLISNGADAPQGLGGMSPSARLILSVMPRDDKQTHGEYRSRLRLEPSSCRRGHY